MSLTCSHVTRAESLLLRLRCGKPLLSQHFGMLRPKLREKNTPVISVHTRPAEAGPVVICRRTNLSYDLQELPTEALFFKRILPAPRRFPPRRQQSRRGRRWK